MGLLDWKIALITGAGAGIGKHAAIASLREGAVFVASERASFLTGVVLAVDGG